MKAVFVRISNSKTCYMNYNNLDAIINLTVKSNAKRDKSLKQGDLIVVQHKKEGKGLKLDECTPYFELKSKYFIISRGNFGLSISKKINDKEKFEKLLFDYKSSEFKITVRTIAENVDNIELIRDLEEVISKYNNIVENSIYRTVYSNVYKSNDELLEVLFRNKYDKIIVDKSCEDVYNELKSVDKESEIVGKMTIYDDKDVDIDVLYGLSTKIERLLNKKVNLKSGANIIIEKTEALTVIDVNSAKDIKFKTALKTNLEAAFEIARQIRLRNISGIIIIDFINMDSNEDVLILKNEFEKILMNDKVPTNICSITSLGLFELTRQRIKKPLYEQLQGLKLGKE